MSNTYTIWVCDNCSFHHANGDCGDCHSDEGHDETPWRLYQDYSMYIAMGMLSSEHPCSAYHEPLQEREGECDCETNTFSQSSCDGCGTRYHGARHAFTVWENS